jgi:transcriptional regulator with XRE-family HTH domain
MEGQQKKAWIDLRKLRTEHGLIQEEASEKMGVTRAYLSAIENGRRDFSLRMIQAIIRVFNVKYEDFYQ